MMQVVVMAVAMAMRIFPSPPHPTPAEMMAQLMETQRAMGEVLCGLAQNGRQGRGRY